MVVGQRVVAGETMIMLAEISTATDDKALGNDDANVAEAEALAVEALRLAEEAKQAAQRLAEVRATLNFLRQLNSPKEASLTVDTTSIVEEKKESEVVDEPHVETVVSKETEAPQDEASAADTAAAAAADVVAPVVVDDVVTPTTATVSSPTNTISTPTSPVSILKNPASKSGPKEVRYAPDTVDPALSPCRKGQLALAETPTEEDIIVKLYDAVGIDKICGLNFGSEENASAPAKKKSVSRKLIKKVDPFAGTTFLVEDPSKDEEEEKKEESTAVTIEAKSEPEEEANAPHDELTPVVAASTSEVEPEVEVALVASPPEEVVTEESTEEPVAKVDPPTSTVEVATAEESSPTVTTEPLEEKEGEAATPVKAAEPKGAKSPLTVDTTTTTTTSASSSVESPRKMTPLMKKALARQRSPVLAKPDPFGGEHDDMDFIPCGTGDITSVDDADEEMKQLSSPRMLCGWAV